MQLNITPYFTPEEAPTEHWLQQMRVARDSLLKQSDWTQASDNPTGNAEAWATYRQQLRDFPATWTPAPTADFPEPPA